MFLSQLVLNPRHRRTQSELASAYEMHRTVMEAFPEDLPDDERVLYRVDVKRETGVPKVLVQSQYEPNWSFLDETNGYLMPTRPEQDNPACCEFDVAFATRQILAFRLRANPTFKRDGSRLAYFEEEDQREWLHRKAERGGFRVGQVTVIPEGWQETQKHPNANSIKHYAVRFDGQLQVADPAAFHETLESGIGPAKAFGFGMLSLAKPR